jgi:hypothetical protein
VFRRTGVPETGRDATQVQLHPVMLRTRRTTTVMIRVPMTAGATDRLEFEDPRIVLIIEIFIGDQFNITARLRADQRGPGLLPDECPVVRIAHPQGRSSRLMSEPGMPLTLRVSAWLHVSLSHTSVVLSVSRARSQTPQGAPLRSAPTRRGRARRTLVDRLTVGLAALRRRSRLDGAGRVLRAVRVGSWEAPAVCAAGAHPSYGRLDTSPEHV